MDHSKLNSRDGVFWMEVYERLSDLQMEKVWSRIIFVHSYSMFACFNVLVLCAYFFFFNFRIINLVDRQC